MVSKHVLILVLLAASLLLIAPMRVSADATGDELAAQTLTYYTYDSSDISGTTVIDSAGLVNGTLGSNASTGHTGIIGQANNYTAATNYEYTYFGNDDTPIPHAQTVFSVAAWVRDTGTTTTAMIVNKQKGDGGVGVIMLYRDGTDYLRFSVGGASADYCVARKSPYPITDTNWHFVVGTQDASQCRLWLDGVNIANGTVNTDAGGIYSDASDFWAVGESVTGAASGWEGVIDEVAIYNTTLTASQIEYLYNSGVGVQYPYSVFVNSSINASTYLVVDTNCTAWRNDTTDVCYTFNSTPTVTFSTLSNATCAISTTEENYTTMISGDPERNCTVTGGTSHECTVSQGDSFRWGSHPLYISCEAPDGTEDDPSSSGALNLWKNWTGILIHAHDEQDNTTLTGWTAAINGSGYTNSSPDSSGWALFEGVSGNYTVNISKAGHWDAVSTYDIPSQDYEVNISMHQSEFTTTAEEIVTGYTMTDYDVWEDGSYLGKCSAALGCTWHSKSGTHTVTMGKRDVYGNPTYYNSSSSVYMPPAGSNSTHEVLHDAELHVNGTNAMTGVKILNYTLTTTLSSPSYTDNQTTSTGDVTVPLKQGYTYDVFINPAQYSNDEVNITVPSGNMTVYHTFILYSMNSFTITVYDEDTRQPLNGANQTVHVEIAGATSFNGTADGNASVYADLLTPGEYRITATADGYAQSDYYYHLYPKTHNFIDLYMLNSTEASYVNFVIEDNYGTTTPGAVVELLRYYTDIDYTVVRMAESSFDGVARLPLEPENVWYKLIILRNWTAYDITEPKKFASTDTSFTINVNFESSVLTSFYAFQQMQKSLTYNSDTGVFAFTWTDSSGLLDEACLKVSKTSFISDETVCDECSTATAGQLLCTINKSVEGEYSAIGKLETATKYSSDLTRLSEKVSNSLTTFGIGGVVVSVFVIGAVALLASGMIEASIALTLLGMVTLYLAGILVAVQTLIAGIVIIGVVILFTIKRRGGY